MIMMMHFLLSSFNIDIIYVHRKVSINSPKLNSAYNATAISKP